MNIEHMAELRDRIAGCDPTECNMNLWRCGTTCCLGGHAELLMMQKGIFLKRGFDIELVPNTIQPVADWLGLSGVEAQNLFYDYPFSPVDGVFDWKAWMLQRLDQVMALGIVPPLDFGLSRLEHDLLFRSAQNESKRIGDKEATQDASLVEV